MAQPEKVTSFAAYVKKDPTIEQLMQLALAGDNQAYAAALTEITGILRPYLFNRLKEKPNVDDVLQEILVSVHKARHTYDGKRPFLPWLFAIANFRLKDHLRKYYADKLQFTDDLNEMDKKSPDHVTESPLTYECIDSEIKQLAGKQPQILTLLHRDGYTAKEVASSLGMKENAVKVAAHRAYKILRKKLAS